MPDTIQSVPFTCPDDCSPDLAAAFRADAIRKFCKANPGADVPPEDQVFLYAQPLGNVPAGCTEAEMRCYAKRREAERRVKRGQWSEAEAVAFMATGIRPASTPPNSEGQVGSGAGSSVDDEPTS